MTSIKKLALATGMIVSLLSLNVYAQSAETGLKNFSTTEVSFDYPAGYSVTDESTDEAWQFVITRKERSVQLTIVVLRRMVQQNELPAALDEFKEPLVKKTAITLGQADSAGTPIKHEFGSLQAGGVRLRSSNAGTRIADVVWLRWSLRLVALTFIRSADEETVEAPLWETVRSSLKVEPPVIGNKPDGQESTAGSIRGGVLNGKALKLARPAYPDSARKAKASGTVQVQVLIDEKGNVISAHAVSGHPLLYAACVAAAMESKFSPTRLSGQPVKVTGIIQYNFVAR